MSERPSMQTSPSSAYVGGQWWRRPYEDVIHDPKAIAQGKVPAWTAEDEANLTRRVKRMAAK